MTARKPASCSFVIAVGAGLTALVVAIFVIAWLARGTGTDCHDDTQCNSHRCLRGFRGDGTCTDLCRADEDCPDDMRCGVAYREGPSVVPLSSNERHVCVPR